MYTFTNFGSVTISIRHFALGTHFRYLTIRFTFISPLSVGQMIFRAVSLTQYMMSGRSWHMYNNFPAGVLYTGRLSFSSSTSNSVVGVLLTTHRKRMKVHRRRFQTRSRAEDIKYRTENINGYQEETITSNVASTNAANEQNAAKIENMTVPGVDMNRDGIPDVLVDKDAPSTSLDEYVDLLVHSNTNLSTDAMRDAIEIFVNEGDSISPEQQMQVTQFLSRWEDKLCRGTAKGGGKMLKTAGFDVVLNSQFRAN